MNATIALDNVPGPGTDPATGIETLEVIGVLAERAATRKRGGSVIRVAICDAGNGAGPVVDVARYFVKPPTGDVTDKGYRYREGRTRLGYLQPFECTELAEYLILGAEVARSFADKEVGR